MLLPVLQGDVVHTTMMPTSIIYWNAFKDQNGAIGWFSDEGNAHSELWILEFNNLCHI